MASPGARRGPVSRPYPVSLATAGVGLCANRGHAVTFVSAVSAAPSHVGSGAVAGCVQVQGPAAHGPAANANNRDRHRGDAPHPAFDRTVAIYRLAGAAPHLTRVP